MAPGPLRVVRAAELPPRRPEQPLWLVEGLWGEGAVGVIGGAPKSAKTWLALEIAVAVASGQPCLGRFAVPRPGPVLFYAAEDAPEQIRERVEHLARARQAEFTALDVRLILEPSLRLDRTEDLGRLRATLARHRPRLLVLDPYVRLQRVAENDVQQVSAILAALRELSRAFQLALALVHHTRKNPAEPIGYALRGSGDFNAWGDSNLYLLRRQSHLLLCVEHRFAPAGPPQPLSLVSDPGPPRLELREGAPSLEQDSLLQRVIASLSVDGPRPQHLLRRQLRVRNQYLSQVLRQLQRSGQITHGPQGWQLMAQR
jgi:hypothetical protein